MPMSYLQVIDSARSGGQITSENRFLVSGSDSGVRQIIGDQILSLSYSKGKKLFLLDNTTNKSTFITKAGSYRITELLDGEISLCRDLLEADGLYNISRLRTLLFELGFDSTASMRVISYLKFVKETEKRLGNQGELTASVLKEYSGVPLIRWKLNQLLESGKIDSDSYNYLIGRYCEMSSAAADFENFLSLLTPFLNEREPSNGEAVHIPVGDFAGDGQMQKLMCRLLISYIKQDPKQCCVMILDKGKGDRSFLIDTLCSIPQDTEIHMMTKDAFYAGEAETNLLMNVFPVRIYTRHESMASCEMIESACGNVEVIKKSTAVAYDRRIMANSAWDLLLGTNKTETTAYQAPVREPRYWKEMVSTLSDGAGIIDCGGWKVLYSFY